MMFSLVITFIVSFNRNCTIIKEHIFDGGRVVRPLSVTEDNLKYILYLLES